MDDYSCASLPPVIQNLLQSRNSTRSSSLKAYQKRGTRILQLCFKGNVIYSYLSVNFEHRRPFVYMSVFHQLYASWYVVIERINWQRNIAGGVFPLINIIPIITLIEKNMFMFFKMIPETHSPEEITTVQFARLEAVVWVSGRLIAFQGKAGLAFLEWKCS